MHMVCVYGLCAVSRDFKKRKNNMEEENEKSLSKAEIGVLSTGRKAFYCQAGHGSDFQPKYSVLHFQPRKKGF